MTYYTGIGSRDTPSDILVLMQTIAYTLTPTMTLRSGGADGADSAFEQGCDDYAGKKEIYLPWRRFNDNDSPLFTPTPDAHTMAAEIHPAWHRCSQGARKLHARNCHQVLGHDLNTPSAFIVFYAKERNGHIQGGTAQAIRIAKLKGIRTYNLFEPGNRNILFDKLLTE